MFDYLGRRDCAPIVSVRFTRSDAVMECLIRASQHQLEQSDARVLREREPVRVRYAVHPCPASGLVRRDWSGLRFLGVRRSAVHQRPENSVRRGHEPRGALSGCDQGRLCTVVFVDRRCASCNPVRLPQSCEWRQSLRFRRRPGQDAAD